MTYRVHKTRDYTAMSNIHLRDCRLSLKAKGLLSLMLSLPDEWAYSVKGIASICKESNASIEGALKELKVLGYLVVTKKFPNETESRHIEYEYDVFESPQGGENQGVENQGVEFQGVENRPQLNTKELNTKELNTNNIKETHKEIAASVDCVSEIEVLFNSFWEAYPKKVNKKGALRTFRNIKSIKKEFPEIMKALDNFKSSQDWTKENGRFIPYPQTWLNQERWKDTASENPRMSKSENFDWGFMKND